MANTREIVLEILLELEREKEYSNVLIRQVLDKYDYLDGQDKSFMKRMSEGCIERKIELDYILNQFSKVPVNKMKPLIRCLMRMSTYQMFYMDSIPDSAICNEAVKLAERRKFGSLKGFVNGVLRNIARNRDKIVWPDEEKDWKQYLSVRASMPMEIIDLWNTEYGKENTRNMVNSFLSIKPVSIRMDENLNAEEKESILKAWDENNILYKQHPYLSYAYECTNIEGLRELPGFEEGKVTVQDVSSMLVSECAGLQKGAVVLDVCAAPGGKSLHAACKLQGTGMVEARDLTERKVEMILENAERMQLSNIHAEVGDATVKDETLMQSADVLLLDVPCSGLGIMGKKRDIKYHVTKQGLQDLTELQKKIVRNCMEYVKPGGTVIYSTCTVRKEENQMMANWIQQHFDCSPESLDSYLPEILKNEETAKGMLQLYPGIQDSDGFFLARFRKL